MTANSPDNATQFIKKQLLPMWGGCFFAPKKEVTKFHMAVQEKSKVANVNLI